MVRVERHEQDFVLAVGDEPHNRIPARPEAIQELAELMTLERIREIQAGEAAWACGEWSLRAAGADTQYERDMKRMRVYLTVGERRWHLLGTEVLILGQSCQRALKA